MPKNVCLSIHFDLEKPLFISTIGLLLRLKDILILEDDNFDPQAANTSAKPEICMRQMTHKTILVASDYKIMLLFNSAENAALAEYCLCKQFGLRPGP